MGVSAEIITGATLTSQLILKKKTGGGVKGDLRPVFLVANVTIHTGTDFMSTFS